MEIIAVLVSLLVNANVEIPVLASISVNEYIIGETGQWACAVQSPRMRTLINRKSASYRALIGVWQMLVHVTYETMSDTTWPS